MQSLLLDPPPSPLQLLETGRRPADPHPGNLLLVDEGDPEGRGGKLAYLDFGLVVRPVCRVGDVWVVCGNKLWRVLVRPMG